MERKLPAYPLFVKDPNFSLWATTDDITEENVKTWYGEDKPVYGFVRTDEGVYCFLGKYDDVKGCGVLRAKQTDIAVTAFATDYTFAVGKGILNVSFVSPLPPDDVMTASLPACYMKYSVTGVPRAEVSLFLHRRICHNASNRDCVNGGVVTHSGYKTAFFGLRRQLYLSVNDDGAGADWGRFYLSGQEAVFTDGQGMAAYLAGGIRDFSHTGEDLYLGALGAKEGRFAVAYDDTVAIDYFGDFRKTLYLENHTIFDAIDAVMTNGNDIDCRLRDFDAELKRKAKKIGDAYYEIAVASLRQCMAAHKIVGDGHGKILFLSKENGSNGCIATVDVSYPSMPLFLLYNTELLKGMMRPIFRVASLPVWTYDFAPHDAGAYPACCGQVYGISAMHGFLYRNGNLQTHYPYYLLPADFDLYDAALQMPLEESADMILMTAACYVRDGDISFFAEHKEALEKWGLYLVRYGGAPDNQLCTDDFAGHLKNNLNLAVKATVGIGAYALLANALGDSEQAAEYGAVAKQYAERIEAQCKRFSLSPLTIDGEDGTFSLKYNLAWDKILGLHLFSQELREKETDGYIAKQNTYGTPLDSRKTYTKSDWICWTAALTDSKDKQRKMIEPLVRFLHRSPARIPFCDWFDSVDAATYGFKARSVVGGHFILLLADELLQCKDNEKQGCYKNTNNNLEKKIMKTIAIIGCGRIANNAHFPALKKIEDVQIKYVCDIIVHKAQAAKEKFAPQAEAITDYKIALSDKEIDGVFVLTPNYAHYTITMDALKAGKHVFCEKPITVDYAKSVEMAREAEKQNKILQIGVCNRYNKAVETIEEYIRSGKLGKVYHVYCSFRSFRCIPGLGGDFTTKAQSGGGVLIDWGVHFLDLILYVLGGAKLKTVSCEQYCEMAKNMKAYKYKNMWAEDTKNTESGTNDVDDFISGFIRTDKANISFNGAWAQNIAQDDMFIDFMGDKGGIRLSYGGKFTYTSGETLETVTPEYEIPDMYGEEDKAFLAAMTSGKHNKAHVENILESAKLLDALYASAHAHKELTL